jgi:hypothetical protein
MKQTAPIPATSSRNVKYIHVLSIWDEMTDIIGGDRTIAAMLTAAFFCSQLAGSTPNPYSKSKRSARAKRQAIDDAMRGNPRNRSRPNRSKA